MNYKQYIKLNEALKNYSYQIPTDKSELLFDFYMSTFLTTTNNDNIDYTLKDMKERLYPYLKKELLEVVLFSITAELRHVFDRNQSNLHFTKETKSFLRKYAKEYGHISNDNNFKVFDREEDSINRRFQDSENRRKNSYMAAKKTTKNKILIVESAMDAFFNGAWNSSYGGNKWGDICDGWLKLNKAETLNEMTIWVDHVYDLQHNNDTVLNKVQRYSRDGSFRWINKALDLKRDIKSPYEIFDKISPSMKRIAGFVIKENEGTTLELWARKKNGEIKSEEKLSPQKNSLKHSVSEIVEKVRNYIMGEQNLKTKKEILNYLASINVNVQDSKGTTTMMHFATIGYISAVRILLKSGADLNIKNVKNETALYLAAERGFGVMVQLLLENDADPHIVASSGFSAIGVADDNVARIIEEFLRKQKEIKNPITSDIKITPSKIEDAINSFLIGDISKQEVDKYLEYVNVQENGRTALYNALSVQHLDVAEFLINNGALINTKLVHGDTALLLSVKYKYIDIIKLLLKYGADQNIVNDWGDTALTYAISMEYIPIIKLLSNKLIEVDNYNKAMKKAKFLHNQEIIDLLNQAQTYI